jgi:PAS domain S-box-containing protein
MEAQTGYASAKNDGTAAVHQLFESSMIEIDLDEAGIIRNCNGACEQMVGFMREELVSHPISMLIRKLSEYQLVLNHDLNPVLDYICHCGMLFQVKTKAGALFFSQLRFVYLQNLKVPMVRLLASPMAPGYNGPPILP